MGFKKEKRCFKETRDIGERERERESEREREREREMSTDPFEKGLQFEPPFT
jgi:hypothetical protein